MSDANIYKPEWAPFLIPYLTVVSARQSIDFYTRAFGFKLKDSSSAGNGKEHVEMIRDRVCIMFCDEGAFGNTTKAPITQNIDIPVSLYVYCENVDEFYTNAVKNGAISKSAPSDAFWGDRFCILKDLDHYEWLFATHIAS